MCEYCWLIQAWGHHYFQNSHTRWNRPHLHQEKFVKARGSVEIAGGYLAHWEGSWPAALHQRCREVRRENQCWACQCWQPSVPQIILGKQSIKPVTTCHLHSLFFEELLACWSFRLWGFFSTAEISPVPSICVYLFPDLFNCKSHDSFSLTRLVVYQHFSFSRDKFCFTVF